MAGVTRITACVAALLVAAACQTSSRQDPPPAEATEPPRASDGPILVKAPAEGDVATYVAAEAQAGQARGYRTLVYVGATWCEPCQYFKQAVAAGDLRDQFPDLRLLEFDSDRDDPRLEAAGYGSTMIPLFVVPGPDGRGTDARIAGGAKGPEGVAKLVPHIAGLLAE